MVAVALEQLALRAARDLAGAAARAGAAAPIAVRCAVGGVVCEVTVGAPARRYATSAACRRAVLAAVAAAGRPLARYGVLRALRAAGHKWREGSVAKALAELTRAGELRNEREGRGYRLPGWDTGRPDQPSLPGLDAAPEQT